MTAYNGNINNLLQGVSQQPRKDRRSEQVGSQENCSSGILKGTGKRQGSTIGSDILIIDDFDAAAKYTYDRGDGEEKYTLVCSSDICSVVDLVNGVITPTIIKDVAYLADFSGEGKDPKDYLKFYTIADTTLIVNTTATPTMSNETTQNEWQAIVHCVQANYGFTYKIIVDSVVVATYTTPSTVSVGTTTASKTIKLKTSDIITNLAVALQAWATTEGVTLTVGVNSFVMYKAVSDGYEFNVYDDNNNNDLKVVGFTTTKYEDLPAKCSNGYKVQVTGTDQEVENDYYTEFIADIDNSTGIFRDGATGTVSFAQGTSGIQSTATPITWTTTEESVPTDTEIIELSVALSETGYDRTAQSFTTYIQGWDNVAGAWLSGAAKTVAINQTSTTVALVFNKETVITKFRVVTTMRYTRYINENYSMSVSSYKYTIPWVSGVNIVQGHWSECVGFNTLQSIDPEQMPHTIKRLSTGDFELDTIDWIDRKSGDDDSNPQPSFIGNPISSISVYQDRLLFLTNENAVASVTYDHYNLFSESVIQSAKDDPIDTTSSDNQVTNLEHILVFNAALMIFSNKAQFVHTAETAFTPDTFALASKSRYSTDITSPPVASANSIFFPFNFGTFSGIREYKIDAVSGVSSAEEITHHVQHYLPGETAQLVSSTDYNILLARLEGDVTAIYVYEWFDSNNERKQASWHRWDFSVDIAYMSIISNKLYLWHEHGTGVDAGVSYITIDLADTDDTNIDFPVRLDFKSEIEATSSGDYWQVLRDLDTLYNTWDNVVVLGGLNSGIEGASTTWEAISDDSGVLIPKNALPNSVGTPSFYIGTKYNAAIELTNPYVRDSQGKPKTSSITTLKTMKVNCSDTGSLEVEVTKLNALTYTKRFTSRIINSPEYLLNSSAPLQTVGIDVPVHYDADRCTITIKSDSHLPFHISDIDWTGSYKEVGRRTV